MDLTPYEIYDVLIDAANKISKSRYSMSFALKGGTVLISRLIESNRMDLFRKTTDIDIHCNNKEVWDNFCRDVECILNTGTSRYRYALQGRRADTKGFDTSDSLRFLVTLADGRTTRIKFDMNIKGQTGIILDFSELLGMPTYSASTMICDKIVAVSARSVFRRIKDIYDIAVLASLYSFRYSDLASQLRSRGTVALTNMLIPQNMPDLAHAYDKFDGIMNKPEFRDLIYVVQRFLTPFYLGTDTDLIWDRGVGSWQYL